MERVAFLIDKTGERISCMLNPETLVTQRTAGIVQRNGAIGALQGARQTDDLLLYVGGGTTEMFLDLLFDTTLATDTASPAGVQETRDVRALTRPLWNLAENSTNDQGQAELPVVRFVWGKSWNVPGLITAVAERLEFFDESGIPRRSWLRMKFCRVSVPDQAKAPMSNFPDLEDMLARTSSQDAGARAAVEVTGGPQPEVQDTTTPSRLDEIAFGSYGNSNLWRLIAWFNNVSDPLRVAAGTLLRLPNLPTGSKTASAGSETL